jgi:hypothetical protein
MTGTICQLRLILLDEKCRLISLDERSDDSLEWMLCHSEPKVKNLKTIHKILRSLRSLRMTETIYKLHLILTDEICLILHDEKYHQISQDEIQTEKVENDLECEAIH